MRIAAGRGMMQDFRQALRELRRRPIITLVAALSLALGIGANSAIFSYVDGLYLRPIAVPNVDSVVRVFASTEGNAYDLLSYPEFEDLRKVSAFSGVASAQWRGASYLHPGGDEGVSILGVSPDFFQVMGIQAEVGRVFGPADREQLPVLLGHSAWQKYFGGDPKIIGKAIRISRGTPQNVTIAGVLPASVANMAGVGDRDVWMPPVTFAAVSGGTWHEFEDRRNNIFLTLARLKPGVSLKQAQAELDGVSARLAKDHADVNARRRFTAMSDLGWRLHNAGVTGMVLVGVVLLVVAVACVNVANLLLARVEGRRQELAIRAAIGATQWRIMRQLLAESALIGLLAALLGILFARWLVDLIPALTAMPEQQRLLHPFRIDGRVGLFTVAISLLTILLFGLAPAWIGAATSLTASLKNTPLGLRRYPLRNLLALAQVAVSLVLLSAAAMLVQSFRNARGGNIGIARKNVLNLWTSRVEGGSEQVLLERLRGLPGVRNVGLAFRAPMSASGGGIAMHVSVPGHPDFSAGQTPVVIKFNSVDRQYFNVMGIPLLQGRTFTDADSRGAQRVVVISETMKRRFWPNEDPVGRFVKSSPDGFRWQIVGVVADAPINALSEIAESYFYTSWWQNPLGEYTLLVETQGPTMAAVPVVRAALKQIHPRLERNVEFASMDELIDYRSAGYRRTAQMVTALGALGLLLTAVGLYGVIAYGVTLRTREIGIRMALGARAGQTARVVMLDALKLALGGITVGLPLAYAATRAMKSMLFGVSPGYAPAFVITALLLAVVAVVTAWLPARRASNVNPLVALRYE